MRQKIQIMVAREELVGLENHPMETPDGWVRSK